MNDSNTIHLQDDKFSSALSKEMQLYIKVEQERICYAIINNRENRLMALYDAAITNSVEETIANLLEENDYLRLAFSAINVSVQTLNFTFIPAQYYTRDNMQGYEKLAQAHDGTKTIVSTINGDTIKCVMALEQAKITPFMNAFSEVRFLSQAEPLIEAAFKAHDLSTKTLIFQFNKNLFEVCATTEDKLLLYNIFSIENADEFNYYLVMIMNQLSIEGDKAVVILAGGISPEDDLFQRICKYFTNIRFADPSSIVTFNAPFDQLPKHKYFSLLSMVLCE